MEHELQRISDLHRTEKKSILPPFLDLEYMLGLLEISAYCINMNTRQSYVFFSQKNMNYFIFFQLCLLCVYTPFLFHNRNSEALPLFQGRLEMDFAHLLSELPFRRLLHLICLFEAYLHHIHFKKQRVWNSRGFSDWMFMSSSDKCDSCSRQHLP